MIITAIAIMISVAATTMSIMLSNVIPNRGVGSIHSGLNYRPFEVLRLISSKNLN